jgi:hypothetical protein
MDVRVRVKAVEPRKFPAGRKTVEGETLRAKSGSCAVVEVEVVETIDEFVVEYV